MLKTFNIHLTPKINLKILKKNNNFLIYIYNNFYFLKLILDKSSQLFFEENSMTLVIQFKFLKNNNKILENLINLSSSFSFSLICRRCRLRIEPIS